MQSLEKLQGKTGKGVGLPLPALYWIGLNHNLAMKLSQLTDIIKQDLL